MTVKRLVDIYEFYMFKIEEFYTNKYEIKFLKKKIFININL